ncbi:MAG: GNAT family N-acetyltransferase [Lachnospiraceae bacterium]|nr:GNAT family N-acetyltransferase [Lachnospiraceae bacterium]
MALNLFQKVRLLEEKDIESTARFYADNGKYVEYFQKMFSTQDCTEAIYTNFKPDVAASIRTGLCLGIFDHDIMIGCILAVDWNLYKQEHPTLFDHMFLPELQTTKDIDSTVARLSGPTYFVYAVLVNEKRRCQGIGTVLVKKFTKTVGDKANIVSDCVYENASPIWLKNGFAVRDISADLNLAVKEI